MSSAAPDTTKTQAVEYHPAFALEVRQVAFMVDGQGFKTDATRLSQQSEFIQDMLFNGSDLGGTDEGSPENPIFVPGCTKETFANFLRWFNHTPWESVGISALEGNLDVLHITHMWMIKEGFDYAVAQLQNTGLPAARRLELARRYDIDSWWDSAVRDLLINTMLREMCANYIPNIGIQTFAALAVAKEAIEANRKRVSVSFPYPKDLDNAPFCGTPTKCKEVWFTVWIREIGRFAHSNLIYTPMSEVINAFRQMPFQGMHAACKDYVINYAESSIAGFQLEEIIITRAVVEIRAL